MKCVVFNYRLANDSRFNIIGTWKVFPGIKEGMKWGIQRIKKTPTSPKGLSYYFNREDVQNDFNNPENPISLKKAMESFLNYHKRNQNIL